MPIFDEILILDWSAAGTPRRGRDSIWLGSDRAAPVNLPTRHLAQRVVLCRLFRARRAGRRVLLGADVAFAHPSDAAGGLAARMTGCGGDALALWAWLANRIGDDHDNVTSYRTVAGAVNEKLGHPVFWGNNARIQHPHLPRLRPAPHPDLPPHRQTETLLNAPSARPKSPWQLAGAGAVGAQALTGIPRLHAIARRTGAAIWPFRPTTDAAVVIAEIYPAMIAPATRGIAHRFAARDAAEVHLLAAALRHLDDADALTPLLRPDPRLTLIAAEGQILGLGHEDALLAAARAAGDAVLRAGAVS